MYWHVKNYTARIVQHEIAHLNGKLFVDEMVPNTIKFYFWLCDNAKYGKFDKALIETIIPRTVLSFYWNLYKRRNILK